MLPGLSKLTALMRLEVDLVSAFHPSVLVGCTQLQHLRLEVTNYKDDSSRACTQDRTSAMLQEIGTLQHLTSLCLTGDYWSRTTPAAYAGLTASTHLQTLALGLPLPRASWKHMFPEAGHCPNLQVIDLKPLTGCKYLPAADTVQDGTQDQGRMEAMIESCPTLQRLDLPLCSLRSLGTSSSILAALQHATSTTHLTISEIDDAGLHMVGHLTQLKELHIHFSCSSACCATCPTSVLSTTSNSSVSIRGVQNLTSLQQLTSLSLTGYRDINDAEMPALSTSKEDIFQRKHLYEFQMKLVSKVCAPNDCTSAVTWHVPPSLRQHESKAGLSHRLTIASRTAAAMETHVGSWPNLGPRAPAAGSCSTNWPPDCSSCFCCILPAFAGAC